MDEGKEQGRVKVGEIVGTAKIGDPSQWRDSFLHHFPSAPVLSTLERCKE